MDKPYRFIEYQPVLKVGWFPNPFDGCHAKRGFHRRNLITNYRNSSEKLTLLDAMQKFQLDLNEQLAEKEKLKSVAKQLEFLEVSRLNEEASRIEEQEKRRIVEEEGKKERDK
uniref:Uncharacterized protein n=1 Tax=Romanomermis culicivorax TaxID=13658 RepID=A0A915ILH5_ROMCU